MIHTVTFERNTRTGSWRARCSGCYWSWVGFEDDVKQRAATHDIEWQAVETVETKGTSNGSSAGN